MPETLSCLDDVCRVLRPLPCVAKGCRVEESRKGLGLAACLPGQKPFKCALILARSSPCFVVLSSNDLPRLPFVTFHNDGCRESRSSCLTFQLSTCVQLGLPCLARIVVTLASRNGCRASCNGCHVYRNG